VATRESIAVADILRAAIGQSEVQSENVPFVAELTRSNKQQA